MTRDRREYQREYYREHATQHKVHVDAWRATHKQDIKDQNKRYEMAMKFGVLSHYGPAGVAACVDCGIDDVDMLALDHVGGGGAQHRSQNGIVGKGIYAWIVNNNFPNGFETVCYNHNIKRFRMAA